MSEDSVFKLMAILSIFEDVTYYSPEMKNLGLDDKIRELVDVLHQTAVEWEKVGILFDSELDQVMSRLWRLGELLAAERYQNYCLACRCRFRADEADSSNHKAPRALPVKFCPFCGMPLFVPSFGARETNGQVSQ